MAYSSWVRVAGDRVYHKSQKRGFSVLGFCRILSTAVLAVLLVGCGSSSPSTPKLNAVTITFRGWTPSAVATQIGSAPFGLASLQMGNTLSVVLPTGTANYAVAYVCPVFNDEFVIEANAQDGSALTVTCPPGLPSPSALGVATGSVDTSSISGATAVLASGSGRGASVSANGAFSIILPVGTDDVAFVVQNGTLNATAVKIERSQAVPGAINGGAPIVFGPGDATTMQPFTLNNVPSGFLAGGVVVGYHTANGTSFTLNFGNTTGASGTYPAVPAAATQNGDFYSYESFAILPSASMGTIQTIEVAETTTSGGGPVALTFPAAWAFSGPAPSALPTFNFNYAGFSGMQVLAYQATIIWTPGGAALRNLLSVTATAKFQNGSTSLTVPDLSSLAGFFAPISSGSQVSWIADIDGGTAQQLPTPFFVNTPPNGTSAFVQNTGTYTAP